MHIDVSVRQHLAVSEVTVAMTTLTCRYVTVSSVPCSRRRCHGNCINIAIVVVVVMVTTAVVVVRLRVVVVVVTVMAAVRRASY